jgi:hypothetical protein
MTRSVGNRKYGRRRSIVEVDKEVVENIGNRDDGAYMHGDIEVAGGREGSHWGETRRLLLTSARSQTQPTLQSALQRTFLPPSICGSPAEEYLAALVG